jgi:cytochrome c
MHIILKSMLATVILTATASAIAGGSAEALAQKNGCLMCHGVDKKVLGPSYKEVAAKYKGDKTAEAKLIEKVKVGGTGVWGSMPMPANSPIVKDDDIKTIVQWVLSL